MGPKDSSFSGVKTSLKIVMLYFSSLDRVGWFMVTHFRTFEGYVMRMMMMKWFWSVMLWVNHQSLLNWHEWLVWLMGTCYNSYFYKVVILINAISKHASVRVSIVLRRAGGQALAPGCVSWGLREGIYSPRVACDVTVHTARHESVYTWRTWCRGQDETTI